MQNGLAIAPGTQSASVTSPVASISLSLSPKGFLHEEEPATQKAPHPSERLSDPIAPHEC